MIPTSSAFRHGCKLIKAYFGVVALEDYTNRAIVAIAIHITV